MKYGSMQKEETLITKDIIDGFMKVASASVADAVEQVAGKRGHIEQVAGKRGHMDHSIKPRINDKKIVGPAVTVQEGPTDEALPPQHALDAIDESPEGSVIVISIDAETNVAVWGGLMTAGADANKLAGAVLDGGVRDVTEIRRDSGFQVFARSVSPGTTVGHFKTLSSNEPIVCGGSDCRRPGWSRRRTAGAYRSGS
jgi:regulator of RNase E activity RraA